MSDHIQEPVSDHGHSVDDDLLSLLGLKPQDLASVEAALRKGDAPTTVQQRNLELALSRREMDQRLAAVVPTKATDTEQYRNLRNLGLVSGFEDGNVSEPPADVFATSVGDVVVAEDVPASELADVSPLIDAAPVFPVAATESQAEAPQATESTDQIDIAASALPTVPRPPLISDEALRNMGFVTREMQAIQVGLAAVQDDVPDAPQATVSLAPPESSPPALSAVTPVGAPPMAEILSSCSPPPQLGRPYFLSDGPDEIDLAPPAPIDLSQVSIAPDTLISLRHQPVQDREDLGRVVSDLRHLPLPISQRRVYHAPAPTAVHPVRIKGDTEELPALWDDTSIVPLTPLQHAGNFLLWPYRHLLAPLGAFLKREVWNSPGGYRTRQWLVNEGGLRSIFGMFCLFAILTTGMVVGVNLYVSARNAAIAKVVERPALSPDVNEETSDAPSPEPTVVAAPSLVDSDGDGIPDKADRCPHNPGWDNGCPAARKRSVRVASKAARPAQLVSARSGGINWGGYCTQHRTAPACQGFKRRAR